MKFYKEQVQQIGFVRCNEGDVLDVRCKHNAGSDVTLSTKYSCLSFAFGIGY